MTPYLYFVLEYVDTQTREVKQLVLIVDINTVSTELCNVLMDEDNPLTEETAAVLGALVPKWWHEAHVNLELVRATRAAYIVTAA